jgi:uncharacterized protein YutE (UPF0331/DUF86 family)
MTSSRSMRPGELPLVENRMLRHGVERILTQLVELAAALNEHIVGAILQRVATSYRESFELAEECGLIDKQLRDDLLPSVGMRNILVHASADRTDAGAHVRRT